MSLLAGAADLYRSLRTQKVRAISTVMGITWGTLAVVLLLAFGTSLEAMMVQRQKNLGDGIAIAWGQRTTKSFAGYGKGRAVRLTTEDILALPPQIPELDLISPEYLARETVRVGANVHRVAMAGVYPDYRELRTMTPQPTGRFLNDADVAENRRVIFLGDVIAQRLFGSTPPVGQRVVLRQVPFVVIGVLQPKDQDSSYDAEDKDRVCVPATTFEQVYGRRFINNFVYRAVSPALHDACTRRIYELLGRTHRFDPDDRDAIFMWDTNEEQRMVGYIFFAMNLMFALSGAFTLLVGGIGVGNLMFILVRQRTREIGIKMAVGATPRAILTEVMGQAIALVAVGGVLGFAISYAVAAITNSLQLEEAIGVVRISPAIAMGTIALLATIGAVAGYFPARRAARLDPVLALAD